MASLHSWGAVPQQEGLQQVAGMCWGPLDGPDNLVTAPGSFEPDASVPAMSIQMQYQVWGSSFPEECTFLYPSAELTGVRGSSAGAYCVLGYMLRWLQEIG